MSWSEYLSIEELTKTAAAEFERSRGGDAFNESTTDCVVGFLNNAWSAELYVEDGDAQRGFVFACASLVSLMRGHCLRDGNKRLAWIAFAMTLARIHLAIDATDDEAEELCLNVLRSKWERDDVARWAHRRVVPLGYGRHVAPPTSSQPTAD